MKKYLFIITILLQCNLSFGQIYLNISKSARVYSKPDTTSEYIRGLSQGDSRRVVGYIVNNDSTLFFKTESGVFSGWVIGTAFFQDDEYFKALQEYRTDQISIINTKIKDTIISNTKPQSITIQLVKKSSGTFLIPCNINGIKMNFIFDTGASDVSISLTEALFMIKNGFLKKEDIRGTEYYKIANGKIEEGTKVIIREIEIQGIRLFNVEASIVHDLDAPLLMGQSAIKRLGKIQIDYINNTLTIIK